MLNVQVAHHRRIAVMTEDCVCGSNADNPIDLYSSTEEEEEQEEEEEEEEETTTCPAPIVVPSVAAAAAVADPPPRPPAVPVTTTTNAAQLRSKLKEVLRMKRALLQKKLEMTKQSVLPIATTAVGAIGVTSSTTSRSKTHSRPPPQQQWPPITAIRQLETNQLHIKNINRSGPEHMIRFVGHQPLDMIQEIADCIQQDPNKGTRSENNKDRDRNAEWKVGTTERKTSRNGDSEGITYTERCIDSTTIPSSSPPPPSLSPPPDKKLKKRKLELQAQLAEARLKKSRLEHLRFSAKQQQQEQQQQDDDEETKEDEAVAEDEQEEHTKEETAELGKPNTLPPPCVYSREDLLERKRVLEVRSNVTNLKHMVSKQQVIMEEQDENLATTEKGLVESKESLVELNSRLETVRKTIWLLRIKEKALVEVEVQHCTELEDVQSQSLRVVGDDNDDDDKK